MRKDEKLKDTYAGTKVCAQMKTEKKREGGEERIRE